MKRIIITSLAAVTLMAGLAGSALADRDHGRDRDNRHDRWGERNRRDRNWTPGRHEYRNGRYAWKRGRWERTRYNDNYQPRSYSRVRAYLAFPVVAPPAIRYERYQPRHGYIWVAGHWDWNGYEWYWQAGHYERQQAGRQWVQGQWTWSGDRYVWTPGYWTTTSYQYGNDHVHEHYQDQQPYDYQQPVQQPYDYSYDYQ